MIEILRDEGNFVAVKLSGRVGDADNARFFRVLQAAAQKGNLHLLVQAQDLQDGDARAFWEDVQLDAELRGKIARLAFIGDKPWEAWIARIGQAFTEAGIQSFDANHSKDAWAWVQDGLQDDSG